MLPRIIYEDAEVYKLCGKIYFNENKAGGGGGVFSFMQCVLFNLYPVMKRKPKCPCRGKNIVSSHPTKNYFALNNYLIVIRC